MRFCAIPQKNPSVKTSLWHHQREIFSPALRNYVQHKNQEFGDKCLVPCASAQKARAEDAPQHLPLFSGAKVLLKLVISNMRETMVKISANLFASSGTRWSVEAKGQKDRTHPTSKPSPTDAGANNLKPHIMHDDDNASLDLPRTKSDLASHPRQLSLLFPSQLIADVSCCYLNQALCSHLSFLPLISVFIMDPSSGASYGCRDHVSCLVDARAKGGDD